MIIPSYVDIPVIDPKTGMFTSQWKAIMQQLLTSLITNASDQGIVMPSQDATEITLIETSQRSTPTGNQFNCQFGTIVYDVTNNVLKVALNNAGAPQFHNIVTI